MKLHDENRIAADRMWRSLESRKIFETETGLTDAMTEEYNSRFIDWALTIIVTTGSKS